MTYLPRPARWTSEVTLFVVAQDGTSEGVSGLANVALASPSLAAIIRIHHLYKKKRAGGSIDQAVDQMRKDLRIRAGGENAIRIEFSYPDPAKAQLAASSVASRFIEGNLVLAGRVIDQSGHRPRMQIRLTDPASLPYIQEAPSQLAGARRGLAIGGLLGAAAAWFLGRRRAPASA